MDVSGAAGLNFTEDGRAYSTLDLDHDGDLDLILKNRNGPQLRLLRNDTDNGHHSIAFDLIGRESNRDAVGASVTLDTMTGPRIQQVALGSGFLSQSTKTLYFGLGDMDRVDRAVIDWPSGQQQTFTGLPAGHRYKVVEGDDNYTSMPFLPRRRDHRTCPPLEHPSPGVSPEGISMLIPTPIPPFNLKTLKNIPVTRNELTGRPSILNFWATWCVPCQAEMKLWKEHYTRIRAAGADLVAISVDEPGQYGTVERFVRERELSFPVWLMDAPSLESFNIFYKLLFERAGDMQIPTTMLLNKDAQVVKIYHGVVSMEVLLEDLAALRTDPSSFTRAALPYPGRRLSRPYFRDHYTMAANYYENGRVSEAAFYLEQAVKAFPNDARSWNKLGAIYSQTGRAQEGLAALQKAVAADPNHADGLFDLGIAHMRLNQPAQAEEAFGRAAKLDPNDSRKKLMLDMALARNSKGGDPVRILERYLEQQPDDAEAHNNLGIYYVQRGIPALAQQRFQQATQLDPYNASAFRNLGITYLQQGLPGRAAAPLEHSVELNPRDTVSLFALADAYRQTGRQADALQLLRRILEIDPGHSRARKLLQNSEGPP